MPSLLDCGKLETFPASVRQRAIQCGMTFPLSLREFIADTCCPLPSMTQILDSGPPGTKKNIAVLGDGFAAGDQVKYNKKVKELLLDGVFGHDYFYEDRQAFNVYRVNLISNDSGVSQRKYDEKGTFEDESDDTIISTTLKDTALGIIYSGSWAHCWMEWGTDTGTKINNALSTWVPDYDLVLIILNETGGGGCGGGGYQTVTMGSDWSTMAHEFGHGTGGLADEYCKKGTYTGSEPGKVNVTKNTDRATLKWGGFVAPTTPVPTGVNPSPGNGACTGYNQGVKPADWSDSQDVGLFEGAMYKDSGIYRPVINCRMRRNSPPYCPVCYTELKTKMHTYTGHTFNKCYAGDFSGDGHDDLLVHNGNGILIYRSDGSQLDLVFSSLDVPGWIFSTNDQFLVGDLNGDGKDEVAIFNGADWAVPCLGLLVDDGSNGLEGIARYDGSLPGWDLRPHDRFFLADIDGDGKKDLLVFNGTDWPIGYLGVLRSTGTGFTVLTRYDGSLLGWTLRANDLFLVGDFSGDGKEDLWAVNNLDWAVPYLGMLQATGTGFAMSKKYDSALPGWTMGPADRHYVGDLSGDGKADLFVFNGSDWSMPYLGMLRSTGSELQFVHRYDGNAPGWQMREHDSHWVADISGDGKADLFVYNHADWAHEYLGTMLSTGTGLNCSRVHDWVGEWNLGPADKFIPCNYEGVAGQRDLFVHNTDWFGMIRAAPGLSLQRIYYRWIHNYRYGRNW